jgi:hypothetical protein
MHCPKPMNAEQFAKKYSAILLQMKMQGQQQTGVVTDREDTEVDKDRWPCQENKRKRNTPCQECRRIDKSVYRVDKPGTFDGTKIIICNKCFKVLDRKYNQG